MVPAADKAYCQLAMNESFEFINTMPQNSKLNQGAWKKIEDLVRSKVRKGVNATVYTGTAFLPEDGEVRYAVLGKTKVAVPTHVWKAVRVLQSNGEEHVWCWLMENKAAPPKVNVDEYRVSLDDIAFATGVRIF